MEFHPPFYMLLMMLGLGGIVHVNYSWISSELRTKRNRFGRCQPQVDRCLALAKQRMQPQDISSQFSTDLDLFVACSDLATTLDELGVPYPDVGPSNQIVVAQWFYFLVRISSLSKSRDLKSAINALNDER